MIKVFSFLLIMVYGYAPQTDPIQSLRKLNGTWMMKTREGVVCEQWHMQGKTVLSGLSYHLVKNVPVPDETMAIRREGKDIFFVATVKDQNGGKPVLFKLTRMTASKFIFSNPAHDFPQIVGYEFIGTDSLHAWIAGKSHGKHTQIDFNYKRLKTNS